MDDLRVIGVPAAHLGALEGVLRPFVARIAAQTDGRFHPADIWLALAERDMQAWLVLRGEDILAMIVTQLVRYPRLLACAIRWLAGSEHRAWARRASDVVAEWARAQGCALVETLGRRGWERVADECHFAGGPRLFVRELG